MKKSKTSKAPQRRSPAPQVKVSAKVEASLTLPSPSFWEKLSVDGIVRGLLLFFAATLPLYYDLSVPEVSGDIRWAATEFFAGLCALLLVGQAVWKGKGILSLRQPLLLWVALGLGFWAALSLVDALNPSRGIVLIKALYSHLILITCVYAVAHEGYGRKLLWALAAPLFITSIIGMWQFQGMTDVKMDTLLDTNWFWWLFSPLVWVGDMVVKVPLYFLGWEERHLGVVGFATQYFLQSAVPGSTFANKNLAGSWTAMMLPVAAYLLLTSKRWTAQGFAAVLLGLGATFLVYSRARASWVALFAALMTLIVLVIVVPAWRKAVWRHFDLSHIGWMMIPLAMVAYWGGDISPVQGSYAVDRTPAQQVEALTGSSWNEIGGRLAYNLNSTVITKDYWFNGVGLGSFFTIYPPYYNAIVVTPWNSYNVMARPQRTHTDMMQAFDEMGIMGGLLYVGIFVGGIAMAFRLGGRKAGALGGHLVGAGMMTMVLALTVFLEWQSMLAIPSPWNVIVQLGMAVFILVMLGMAIMRGWQVQREQKPADDVQLMGLMAGVAVLCISINALMDFPMQLPTAPAAAALLIGVILSVYMSRNPQQVVGPKVEVATGRGGPVILFVLLAAAFGWAMYDCYTFREGNKLLKMGMVRLFSGVNDDTTLALLEKAYEIYPYDQRIQEHIGVVYANYNGARKIPLDERIAKLEWVHSGDPWGANHMINLSGQYLVKAQEAAAKGDKEAMNKWLGKAEYMFGRLQKVADFSHFTWGIGGMIRSLQGNYQDATWMFRRALAIEPGYLPAQVGLQMVISNSGVRPVTVQDQMIPR